MASKLSIYNGALLRIGEIKLASLSESRPSRYALDAVWDNGFVRRMLERGQWNFATRTVELIYDSDLSPQFGYQYGFSKPEDWVRTLGLSTDPYIREPLLYVKDERNYWFCDEQVIYVSYVSSDDEYGGDISLWPESVVEMAEIELAHMASSAITDSETVRERLEYERKRARIEAKSVDQMNDPPKMRPMGTWARARYGYGRWGYCSNPAGGAIPVGGSSGGSSGGGSSDGAFSDGFSDGFS